MSVRVTDEVCLRKEMNVYNAQAVRQHGIKALQIGVSQCFVTDGRAKTHFILHPASCSAISHVVTPQAHLGHTARLPGLVEEAGGLRVRCLPDPRPQHAAAHRDVLRERSPAHSHDLRHAVHQQGQDCPV